MNEVAITEINNKPSNNLYRLLQALIRDYQQRILKKCRERGHPQIRLSHLSLFNILANGSARITDLAAQANITQQAIGKVVKEMEAIGYIRREADHSDKRAKIIELTERGQQLLIDNGEIAEEIIDEYRDCMTENGVDELEQTLSRSVNALT